MIGALRALKLIGLARASGKALSDDALAVEWRAVDAIKAAAEAPMEDAVRVWLRDTLRRMAREIEQIDESALPKRRAQAEQVVSLVADLPALLESFLAMLGPEVARTLSAGFEAGRLRLPGFDLAFDAEREVVDATARRLVAQADSVPGTMISRVVTVISNGLEAGLLPRQLAGAVRDAVPDLSRNQAKAVAQTTGTGAFEAGQLESFRQVGADRRWLSSRDSDVRDTHLTADGQEVGPDEPFTVGGYSAMHPADPNLPAGESINCRCTVLPVITSQRTYAQTRNAEIRARYKALPRKDRTAETRGKLADEYAVSVETIERAIYRRA